jgi:hypothetical protein
MLIIRAIVAGERDPVILASYRRAVQPYLLKVIEMMDLRPPSAAA